MNLTKEKRKEITEKFGLIIILAVFTTAIIHELRISQYGSLLLNIIIVVSVAILFIGGISMYLFPEGFNKEKEK